MNLQEFLSARDLIEPNYRGCKIWPKAKNSQEYPRIGLVADGPKRIKDARNRYMKKFIPARSILLSRLTLEIKLGRRIRDGFMALHTCDTPACIEESHIYEGTIFDNARDTTVRLRRNPARGDRHGSRLHPESVPQGERRGNVKLTALAVMEIRARFDAGERQNDIAATFGVSRRLIGMIGHRLRWRHVI